MHKELLEDIGEKELIKRLAKFMPKNQVLDDCAMLKQVNNNMLVNTDALVENVHFNEETIDPIDLGWKAVACNISDLLSSGSIKTIGITIGLIMPAKTEIKWVEELYKGINQALDYFGGEIIGGDCSLGKEKVISVTAIGIQGDLDLRRNACKPGEIILCTGIHGLSKLGFMVKNKEKFDNNVFFTKKLINNSLTQFTRPRLQTDFLKKLIKTRSNKKIKKIGCTDSSDGFFQALLDLSTASKCKAIIDYKKMPKHQDWPKGAKWDNYFLFGGEDYEFIFSLPKRWAKNYLKIDKNVREIGYFVEGKASVEFKDPTKNELLKSESFKHF